MNVHYYRRRVHSSIDTLMKAEYDNGIDDAARVAFESYMEVMMNDPKVNREETEEKAKFIMDQIMNLKRTNDNENDKN